LSGRQNTLNLKCSEDNRANIHMNKTLVYFVRVHSPSVVLFVAGTSFGGGKSK